MAKKRQQDFSNKTQMKAGRTVAKRRNVTDTSFKAKKIVVPNKGAKHRHSSKNILDYLKFIDGASHISARANALEGLNREIVSNKDSLPSFLSDVLKSVLKLMLEPDENIRNLATDVVINILKCTKDFQLKSFVPLIVNVLSCMMSHSNMRIREHSMKLLTPILKQHPDLICHSIVILNHLIEMLVGFPRTRTHSQTSKHIAVIYSDDIYSPHWRVCILAHINVFLTRMLLKKSTVTASDDRDEQEVYWDSESPMHIQIYASGGLKPVDIEKSYSYSIGCQELCDDSEILTVLDSVMHIFPSIFAEEVASIPKGDDELLNADTIHNFCILFKVLCSISEWLTLVPSEDVEKELKKFLKESVYDKKRFPFKQRGSVFGKEQQPSECVQLNLSVCILYSTYLLESVKNKEEIFEEIFTFVKNVFKIKYIKVKEHAVPMIVKIIKLYFEMSEIPEVSEFLCDTLCQLCSLLKYFDDCSNGSLLKSLFTDMSLDSAYHFVAETNTMDYWYSWLLNKLLDLAKDPKTNSVDKKLLGVIKKIANRRYSCFQKLSEQVTNFTNLKVLLKLDDEVRDTAIFLIYNIKDISTDLLNDIARIILMDGTLPSKFAVRLIRLLTYRFSEKPQNGEIPEVSIHNGKGLINIIQFLLNIAIDSFNVNNERFIDFEANEYTKALKIIKDVTSYSVLPSLHWKEHSVLFEVCVKFLKQLPQTVVNKVAMMMFKEILDNARILPMHTVIAILKLNNREMRERYYRIQIYDLIFTILLTTSILTQMPTDDDWYECNIIEVTNSMELNSQMALETLNQVEFLKDDVDGIVVYHMLRVCKFYIERQLLDQEDFQTVLRTLDILKDKCSDKTIGRQPLFISLYNHFTYYM